REGVSPDIELPAAERASERSSANALLGDWIAPILPARSYRTPQQPDEAQAFRAAIAFVRTSAAGEAVR
ncbi:MAG TPA: hypothetical protein VFZ61_22100, partial [Polyangiales bacterium]